MFRRKEGLEPPIKRADILSWTEFPGTDDPADPGLSLLFSPMVQIRRNWIKHERERFPNFPRWEKQTVERWQSVRVTLKLWRKIIVVYLRLWRKNV